MTHNMKIGDLAKTTGCRVETIRYYEREGLLTTTARSDGNYRLYGVEHVERLRFVRHCRSLDMALDEIRTLLAFCDAPDKNCAEVNVLLDEHIGHVKKRIAELSGLEKRLKTLRLQCTQPGAAKRCGILSGLVSKKGGNSAAAKREGGHVRGAHARGERAG